MLSLEETDPVLTWRSGEMNVSDVIANDDEIEVRYNIFGFYNT